MKAAIAAIVVLAVGGVGYLLGASAATGSAEGKREHAKASEAAFTKAYDAAFGASAMEGLTKGRRAGGHQGKRAGLREGRNDGVRAAHRRLARVAAAEAEAAQLAAQAEEAERAANCGATYFPDDYCPTDEEIARESAAESLCGPGTAEGRAEAARLGISC